MYYQRSNPEPIYSIACSSCFFAIGRAGDAVLQIGEVTRGRAMLATSRVQCALHNIENVSM